MKNLTYILLTFVIISCNTSDNDNESKSLLPFFGKSHWADKGTDIQALLGDTMEIPLETTDNSLVGRINKIVKKDGNYYVLSNERIIHHFDRDGRFLSCLYNIGGGPGEYSYISDFDVYPSDEGIELWLCDQKGIKIYILDTAWTYLRSIQYPFVVNKFKRLPEQQRILLMTGQNNKSLTLSDEKGNVIDSYLDKKIPFLTFKPVQFITFDSLFIYSLGEANSLVSFNSQTSHFSRAVYSTDISELLSEKKILDFEAQLGQDYLRKVAKSACIRSFRKIGKQIFVDYYRNRERYLCLFDGQETWNYIKCVPDRNFESNPFFFLITSGWADSDDGILFFKYPENEDDNPILIETDIQTKLKK